MQRFNLWSNNLSDTAIRQLLVVIFSVVILGFGLLLAVSMNYLRSQTIESATRLTDTYGLLVGEQVTQTLQTVNERMRLVAFSMEAAARAKPGTVKYSDSLFQPHLEDLPFVKAMWFIDVQGKLKLDSDQNNSSTDPSTQQLATAIERFKTSQSVNFAVESAAKNAAGQWEVYVSHAVRMSNGEMVGVIFASLDSEHFNAIWQGIDLGIGGSISLMSHQGDMLMRMPLVEKAMTTNYIDRPLFQILIPAQKTGSYRDRSGVDGVERLFSYRTLKVATNTVVVVGQTVDGVLERWRSWVALVALTWFFGALITLFLCSLLIGALKKKQIAVDGIAESERKYHSLFAEAMDAIFLARPDGSIFSANPAACNMLGYTEDALRTVGRSGILDATDTRLARALTERSANGRFRGVLTFTRKNGEKFDGEVSSSVFHNAANEAQSVIIVRDISERQKSESQLREYVEKLQILSRRVIEAQETERRRIARELHDELGQSLTAIKINLQSGDRFTKQSTENLNAENIRIVEDVLHHVRQLAMALRPSILDNLGLVPALNWLGKQTASRGNLILDVQIERNIERMPQELETAFFRIAQEAFTNTLRHSKAAHLYLSLKQTDTHVQLDIEDDGLGMDWDKVQLQSSEGLSFGVIGMAERAALAGGTFTIRSSPGAGCRITFFCPLALAVGASTP